MTNREKLIKTNVYDILIEMNKNLGEVGYCIMNALPHPYLFCGNNKQNCEKCIQDWLNEEEKSR